MNKILIIQTAFIGDVILATALLEAVHKSHPDAKIDFLLRKGNEALLNEHPFLNDLLIWDKKNGKYKNLFSCLKTIRANKYDAVINLQRFASTGLLTGLSKGKMRIGFDKNPFAFLFTHKKEHIIGEGVHEVERNISLIADFAETSSLKPKLYPSKENYSKVKAFKNNSYICIAPTSVWFTKQYPIDQWEKFIKLIPSLYTVYLLGAPADAQACDDMIENIAGDNVKNLAGKLNLLESAALMQDAHMNYVNDSAPLHLASATNAKITAVFCSTVPEFGFTPLSDDSLVIDTGKTLTCRPCGLHGHKACPKGHFKCAYDIETKRLLDRI